MTRQEFIQIAIHARWLWKQRNLMDIGPALCEDLDKLCMGDRNLNYSICQAWVISPDSDYYDLSADELADRIHFGT